MLHCPRETQTLYVGRTQWIRDDDDDEVGNSHSSRGNLMLRLGKRMGQQGGEKGDTEKIQQEKNYLFLIKTTKVRLYSL